MKSLLSLIFLLAGVSSAAASATFSRGIATGVSSSTFGIVPRGGGLFGGKKEEGSTKDAGAKEDAEKKMYPALTQEEIEDWLAHIPVFAVTDSKGAGVVLKPDNDTSVFYFFMSPQMANATLQQLKGSNEEMDLRVSAFSLGKIWFKILNAESDSGVGVKLKTPGTEEEQLAKNIEYRLVPDTRDLLGARMLLTMDPEEGEKLKQDGGLTPEVAEKAIQKAMTEAPKFNGTFNEIPVFMIAQMRMQKKAEEGDEGETVNLLPMYFSLQNMVSTWQQFVSQSSDAQGVEPAINLMDLNELVSKMQEESEIDFRNVLLIPPVPMAAGGPSATNAEQVTAEDQMAQMGGSTLGDL